MSRISGWSCARLLAVTLVVAPAAGAVQRVFVSSTGCSGDLGACTPEVGDAGVVAANNFCQARAVAAGLVTGGEIFRAWLSDPTADAYCNVLGLAGQRFGAPPCGVVTLPAAGPWQRTDGVPFAASIDDLVDLPGGQITPLGALETGAAAGSTTYMTGSTLAGINNASNDCNDWTGGGTFTGGASTYQGSDWATGASSSCGGPWRIACFEVGAGDPLVYPSAPGALAFVTSASGSGDLSTWPDSGGSGGLAGGDAVCQALAGAAGLPFLASFVAFLSDGATDAADRLTIGGPWERVDGVRLADSKADLLDSSLDDPIALDEVDGLRMVEEAWTGTLLNGSASGADCLGWTSGLAGGTGTPGRPWRRDNGWTGTSSVACDGVRRLFCFSNQLLLGWDSFESGNFHRWSAVEGGP